VGSLGHGVGADQQRALLGHNPVGHCSIHRYIDRRARLLHNTHRRAGKGCWRLHCSSRCLTVSLLIPTQVHNEETYDSS